jgi:DNA-binding NarL/FixJ family response regulator
VLRRGADHPALRPGGQRAGRRGARLRRPRLHPDDARLGGRRGGSFVPVRALVHALTGARDGDRDGGAGTATSQAAGLTPREVDVLNLLREGKPNKIIAAQLDLKETTVKIHVRHIMKKLKATNRTEAALMAERAL